MPLADLPLVEASDMTLLGQFTVPGEFDYGGYGISYDPDGNGGAGSLLLGGPDPAVAGSVKAGEISIPSLSGTASILQSPTTLPNVGNLDKLGGLFVYNGKLYASAFIYYDGGFDAETSHMRSTDRSIANLSAPVTVGTLNPGFYGGYMGHIPTAWQAALGGPAYTGQAALSIISRTSPGPAVFSFDPEDIGVLNPVPATPLLYYTADNPLDSFGAGPTIYHNLSDIIAGPVFVEGTRSVLFIKSHGKGEVCYGTAPAVCTDPVWSEQGYHAYPYVHQVLAYDLLDLQAVADGLMDPWEPQPYAHWELEGMGVENGRAVGFGGVTYDPENRRIFIAGASFGIGNMGSSPKVYVWEHTDFGDVPEEPNPPSGATIAAPFLPLF